MPIAKVRLQVETETGEIPLLPSTRRYIRRMQKQEIVRKESKKFTTSKIDIISFIAPKKAATVSFNKLKAGIFS